MTWPALLIDEDYPTPVARALRELAFTSIEVVAESPLRGATDRALVDHAAAVGGVLVSHNQRDRMRFRAYVQDWRSRGNDTVCVLLLPRSADDQRLLLRTLLLCTMWVECAPPKPETLIWNDAAQALIRGYRPVGYSLPEIRYVLGQIASLTSGGLAERRGPLGASAPERPPPEPQSSDF